MDFDLGKIAKGRNITEIEKQVLQYIIDNIDKVIAMGVRGVAKENYTSTSTIMRLAKKLDYTGFVDMIYNISPMIAKSDKNKSNIKNDFTDQTVNHFLSYISEQNIIEFVNLIKNTNKKIIFVYATGFSAIIANYLSKKILVLGKKCIFSDGGDSVGIFENNTEDIEALIVVSKSGETKVVLDKVNIAKNKEIKVVSFTREIENSISKLSDINFKILDINKLDDKNIHANTFFPNLCMLMEYLIYRYYEELNK